MHCDSQKRLLTAASVRIFTLNFYAVKYSCSRPSELDQCRRAGSSGWDLEVQLNLNEKRH